MASCASPVPVGFERPADIERGLVRELWRLVREARGTMVSFKIRNIFSRAAPWAKPRPVNWTIAAWLLERLVERGWVVIWNAGTTTGRTHFKRYAITSSSPLWVYLRNAPSPPETIDELIQAVENLERNLAR